jgi:hypothetical protein
MDQDQYDFIVEIYKGIMASTGNTDSKSDGSLTKSTRDLTDSIGRPETSFELAHADAVSEYRLKFNNVTLEVLRSRELSENQQFQIKLEKPEVRFCSMVDKSSVAEVQCQDLVLSRKSNKDFFFGNMMVCKNPGVNKVSITYMSQPSRASKFLLVWEEPAAIIDVGLFMDVYGYFYKPWMVPSTDSDPSSDTSSNVYQFHFQGLEAVLLESPSDSLSEAMLIRSKTTVITIDSKTKIMATDLECFLTSMDRRENVAVKISDPFSGSLTLSSEQDSQSVSSNWVMEFQPVVLFLSYTDIPVLKSIIWKNFFNPGSKEPAENEQITSASNLDLRQMVILTESDFDTFLPKCIAAL